MFTDLSNNSLEETRSVYVQTPRVFTENDDNITSGLDKATALFSVVKTNCNKACNEVLEFKENQVLTWKNSYKLDSCVRRCFVQRVQSHFPENNEVTDFLYASAFEYSQRNIFSLDINKYNKSSNQSLNFKGLSNISQTFNNYFI